MIPSIDLEERERIAQRLLDAIRAGEISASMSGIEYYTDTEAYQTYVAGNNPL